MATFAEEGTVPCEVHSEFAIFNVDCFAWLEHAPRESIHAVVTDPPYGLVEYRADQQQKLRRGRGGVWRIPPSFDGAKRRPLPRFTVLSESDRANMRRFFGRFARALMPVLVPGGHVFIATNPLVAHLVYEPLIAAGFEKRGEIVRTVQTLRGGDRPKNAHQEFSTVSVMPRSCWEPWGLFRKPCEGRVQDNLRKWQTGGLRRISDQEPFRDMIPSAPTRSSEHKIAPHPSLKPQHLMRQLVRASLPLGDGAILDPFMGSGSTVAAAAANDLYCVGLETDPRYYEMAQSAIPRLAALPDGEGGPNASKR
ncbi:MAG: DNA-methyltransferase [Armatimonadota bacterium]